MRIPLPVRVCVQLTALVFAAGTVLLYFFIVLAGIKSDGNVLNKWYFLRADTSDLPGAPYPVSQWSLYGVCGYEAGDSISKPGAFIGCTDHKPAYPLDPKRNFNGGNKDDTWTEFRTNRYYYETRFQFAFYLIALFFVTMEFLLAFFTFLARPVAVTASVLSILTFIFGTIAASLSTAAYVKGRQIFRDHGYDAKLGPALYGFMWANVLMAIFNSVLFWFVNSEEQSSPYRTREFAFRRGGYRFGLSQKRTTEVPAVPQAPLVVDEKAPIIDPDASSFVRV